MAFTLKSKLPRLAREFYQGRAVVMWTHGIGQRATGWLGVSFHASFREVLLHACSRFAVVCPCYVLMPDHWHVVLMGLNEDSDQWLATAFLRKHLAPRLQPARLQDRAHDRVLRDEERRQKAFQSTCAYVCANPQRGGLSADWRKWPYLGSMVAGYPDIGLRAEGYWEKYWKICGRLVESEAGPCAHAQGYKKENDAIARFVERGPCAHAQGYEDKGNDPVARSVRSGTTSK